MVPVRVHQYVVYLILDRDTLEDGDRLQRAEPILGELLRALAVLLAIRLHYVVQPELFFVLAVHVVERVARQEDQVAFGGPAPCMVARRPKL